MALHWNLKNCDQTACWDSNDQMTPRAQGLIWATMAISLNEITEKNLSEWCWRLNFEVRLQGDRAILRKSDGSAWTECELRPFVGLTTNASKRTRKQYLAAMIAHLEREHNADERSRSST